MPNQFFSKIYLDTLVATLNINHIYQMIEITLFYNDLNIAGEFQNYFDEVDIYFKVMKVSTDKKAKVEETDA